jgi:hypothetical protein
MSYEVRLLPDEPVIFMTWYDDFSLKKDLEAASEAVRELLDSAPGPLYLITDTSAVHLPLEDLIAGANYAVQSNEPIVKHANIRQVIVIAQSKAVELTVKGMKAASFGNVTITVCATVNEALAYARG